MTQNIINFNEYDRKVLAVLKAKYPGLVISPSFLRLEKKLENQNGTMTFDHQRNGGEISTEVRVDKNDSFFATKAKLALFQRDTATNDQAIKILQTYPNKIEFAAANGLNPDHLEMIYNGKLSIQRANTILVESFPTYRFREVSETQQTSAANKSSVSGLAGFTDLVNHVEITGREAMQIELKTPSVNGLAWQYTTGTVETRVALLLDGFLVKGLKA